jgi:hypothetical protein
LSTLVIAAPIFVILGFVMRLVTPLESDWHQAGTIFVIIGGAALAVSVFAYFLGALAGILSFMDFESPIEEKRASLEGFRRIGLIIGSLLALFIVPLAISRALRRS